MRGLAVAMCGLALAGAAGAQPRISGGPSVITMPDWKALPSAADMAKVYPAEAREAGLGGRAVIACVTTAEGLLDDCAVVAEDPPGAGFGDAALELAAEFKMKPMTRDGHPVNGGKVRIPIVFKTAPPPAQTTAP